MNDREQMNYEMDIDEFEFENQYSVFTEEWKRMEVAIDKTNEILYDLEHNFTIPCGYDRLLNFIRLRDNLTCRLCNHTLVMEFFDSGLFDRIRMYGHHILPRSDFPDFIELRVNMVLLCPTCHMGLHQKMKKFSSVFDVPEVQRLIMENISDDNNTQKHKLEYRYFMELIHANIG